MTISSETRKAGPYTGNGVTTSFTFAFKVFTSADVLVVRTNLSAIESTLVLTTDYTVTLNSNQDSNPGGSVILPAALTTGFLLTLSSQVGALQATDLTNQGGFYPSVLNTALDKLTILVQQLKEQVGRAVKTDISSSVTPAQLISTLNTNAANAVASAASSAASATASANSATTSSNAAATTGANVTAAGNSQTAAAASAAAALTSKNNAATSETNSGNSATAAAASAAAALTSKNNAATSETNAGNSATAAAGSASAASTSATNAANSATNSAASYTSFHNQYQGAYSTPPTLRPDSSALQIGDLYFNTTSSAMFVRSASGWIAAGSSVNGTTKRFKYIASAGQTTFTGADANSNVLAYDSGYIDAYLNGIRLDATDFTASSGTSFILSAAASANDELNIVAFGTFSISNFDGAGINAGTVSPTKLVNSGAELGMRNRIINGGMVFDQRNAGASLTNNTAWQYCLDRWQIYGSVTSKFTVQQNAGSVTPPAGFKNYAGITSLSAYSITSTDQFLFRTVFEGLNTYDLAWGTANAKTVAISFQVYSSLTGTFSAAVKSSSGANRSYPFSYSIPVANTWTTINVTIPGDTSGTWATDNTASLQIWFNIAGGSNFLTTGGAWVAGDYQGVTGSVSLVGTSGATFYITGVQLEKGPVATPFEYRPYGTELALCQRYAFNINTGQLSGNYYRFPMGYAGNTTQGGFYYSMPVAMRTTPSLAWNGSFIEYINNGGGQTGTSFTISGDACSSYSVFMLPSFSSGTLTTNALSGVRVNNSTTWSAILSAEL